MADPISQVVPMYYGLPPFLMNNGIYWQGQGLALPGMKLV